MRNMYWLLPLLLLAGCSKDNDNSGEEPAPQPEVQIEFAPSVSAMSRATETAFEHGDAISVFAVKSDGNDVKGILAESGNYADNAYYWYNGNTYRFTGKEAILQPEDGSALYYHAVYPYSSKVKSKFTFSVLPDAADSPSSPDLMTASTAATKESVVSLKFGHRLAKLIMTFQGEGLPAGDMTLLFKNVYTDVAVDLNAMTFIATGTKGQVIASPNGTNSFYAILPPQPLSKGTEIATVTINGKDYPVTMNNDAELASGKKLECTLTLTSQDEIEFTGDILPWE